METKFNFKSQICTSREQSERLLALGLKPETADMVHCIKTRNHLGDEIERHSYYSFGTEVDERPLGYANYEHFLAWSLHRLIEMSNIVIRVLRHRVSLSSGKGFSTEETLYDNLIDCIEWLIKEGYFNKQYLV